MESEVAAKARREAETTATYIGLKTRAQRAKLSNGSVSASSHQPRSTDEKKKKKSHKPTVDNKYSQWKTLVPILYDSLSNQSLVWPCLSCRSVFLCSRVCNFLLICVLCLLWSLVSEKVFPFWERKIQTFAWVRLLNHILS